MTVAVPATVEQEGKEVRFCTVCNETEMRVIEKLSADQPTTAPEVPTTAPEVPTTAPEVPTTAPEVPTTAPEVPTTKPEEPGEKVLLGDLDGNGKINSADARIALRISAKLDTATDYQLITGDVDQSGKINSADARKILRIAAKLDPIPGFVEAK